MHYTIYEAGRSYEISMLEIFQFHAWIWVPKLLLDKAGFVKK